MNNISKEGYKIRNQILSGGKLKMKKEYDFSKSIKNPYIGKLKKQISIRIENETIDYFRKLSLEIGIPYQNLMNMYLRECAEKNIKPNIHWK